MEGSSTVVVGLGNTILTDDGVGIRVAEALERLIGKEGSCKNRVDVRVSHRAGFDLVDLLQGYEKAIIIDCLEIPDPCPGKVHELTLKDFSGSARLCGPHDIDVATAIELGKRMGYKMPEDVLIFAIEGGDTKTLGEKLTPRVSRIVEPLAKRIYDSLKGS